MGPETEKKKTGRGAATGPGQPKQKVTKQRVKTEGKSALLKLRAEMKRRKPTFRRAELYKFGHRYVKLKDVWRKPKGRHSKIRQKRRGAMPHPHFGAPRDVRGLHPSGLKEERIFNAAQLEGLKLDPKVSAVRIASSVGTKKRAAIFGAAKRLGLRVLNPTRVELKPKKEEKKAEGAAATESKEAAPNTAAEGTENAGKGGDTK